MTDSPDDSMEEFMELVDTFLDAVYEKDHNKVEAMIFDDAPLNYMATIWTPPLQIAVDNLDIKMIDLLLEYGADINADEYEYDRDHILYLATEIESKELVECLLLHDADGTIQHNGVYTPLYNAVCKGNKEIVKLLADSEVIDISTKYGQYPLHNAITSEEVEISKILLENCSVYTLYLENHHSETPLHIASKKGYTDLVKLMLDKSLNIDATDGKGRTALHIASKYGYIDIVELLLKAGSDPNLLNNNQETPKMMAENTDRPAIMELITSYEFAITKPAKR